MVSDTNREFPKAFYLKSRIEDYSRADDNVYLDAIQASEKLFGSHMPANIMVIGAAFQAGGLPVSADAIEKAIELNGVAVEKNIQAFRAGRMLVFDPSWLTQFEKTSVRKTGTLQELSSKAQALVNQVSSDGELDRLLKVRVPELIDYQNFAYARQYVDFIRRVKEKEESIGASNQALSETVARYLFKLMAYKDEYEVARLSLKTEFKESLQNLFGKGANIKYQLHPPFLKALGLKNKIGFGKWFDAIYWMLVKLKFLRGTSFDIFGFAKVRKTERQLVYEYKQMIEDELENLTLDSYGRASKLAALPDMIRGYEGVKMGNVEMYREEVRKLKNEEEKLMVEIMVAREGGLGINE